MLEILADAKFSIFKTAVDKANLSTTFSGSTKYTLFVPTDDVMVAAGLPNVDGLSESQCANLVRYHMLEGVQTATTLPAFGFVTTLVSSWHESFNESRLFNFSSKTVF